MIASPRFWIFLLFGLRMIAQPLPKARFTFDNRSGTDDVSDIRAKFRGTSFTSDRFGNENHAVYIFGMPGSYMNLGTSKLLKPEIGSISIWLKIESEVHQGKGSTSNPVLITKNSPEDNYYEAYAIYYTIGNGRLAAVMSRDSLYQITLTCLKPVQKFEWYHVVLSWSDKRAQIYVNGDLDVSATKDFQNVYNPLDSVLLGYSGNKKNVRYAQVIVDDICFYDHQLTHEEVVALYNAPNPNRLRIYLEWALVAFAAGLLIFLTYLIVQYRLKHSIKKEKQRMELAMLMLETELRVNRALMDPHFVFNSLNSMQNLILGKDYEQANSYLVKFSHLMRKLLEYNKSNSITLEMEVDLLNQYLEIESIRFAENIRYTIFVNPSLQSSLIQIPVMMLQPFAENAILHGLLPKKNGERVLKITFQSFNDNLIECLIEDNGVGRKARQANRKRESLAINFIQQRLELLNRLYGSGCSLEITDKLYEAGTIVRITLPMLNVVKKNVAEN